MAVDDGILLAVIEGFKAEPPMTPVPCLILF